MVRSFSSSVYGPSLSRPAAPCSWDILRNAIRSVGKNDDSYMNSNVQKRYKIFKPGLLNVLSAGANLGKRSDFLCAL